MQHYLDYTITTVKEGKMVEVAVKGALVAAVGG